jgi:hypothetical protein
MKLGRVMEDFKDALGKVYYHWAHSDNGVIYDVPEDDELYHLREAVRYLIICMEYVSVKEESME